MESKPLINTLIKECLNYLKDRRLKKMIAKANEVRYLTGYKCFVLHVKGKLKVVRKKDLKLLIAKRKFKKGTSIQSLEKLAVYKTI